MASTDTAELFRTRAYLAQLRTTFLPRDMHAMAIGYYREADGVTIVPKSDLDAKIADCIAISGAAIALEKFYWRNRDAEPTFAEPDRPDWYRTDTDDLEAKIHRFVTVSDQARCHVSLLPADMRALAARHWVEAADLVSHPEKVHLLYGNPELAASADLDGKIVDCTRIAAVQKALEQFYLYHRMMGFRRPLW